MDFQPRSTNRTNLPWELPSPYPSCRSAISSNTLLPRRKRSGSFPPRSTPGSALRPLGASGGWNSEMPFGVKAQIPCSSGSRSRKMTTPLKMSTSSLINALIPAVLQQFPRHYPMAGGMAPDMSWCGPNISKPLSSKSDRNVFVVAGQPGIGSPPFSSTACRI
jgi:hypothetical protein